MAPAHVPMSLGPTLRDMGITEAVTEQMHSGPASDAIGGQNAGQGGAGPFTWAPELPVTLWAIHGGSVLPSCPLDPGLQAAVP